MRIARRVCIDSFAIFRRYESGWFLSLGSLVVVTRSTSAHVSVAFSTASVHTINGHEDKMETSSRGSWKGDKGMRATLGSALLPVISRFTTISTRLAPMRRTSASIANIRSRKRRRDRSRPRHSAQHSDTQLAHMGLHAGELVLATPARNVCKTGSRGAMFLSNEVTQIALIEEV